MAPSRGIVGALTILISLCSTGLSSCSSKAIGRSKLRSAGVAWTDDQFRECFKDYWASGTNKLIVDGMNVSSELIALLKSVDADRRFQQGYAAHPFDMDLHPLEYGGTTCDAVTQHYWAGKNIFLNLDDQTLDSQALVRAFQWLRNVPHNVHAYPDIAGLSLARNQLTTEFALSRAIEGAVDSLVYLDMSHNKLSGALATPLTSQMYESLMIFDASENAYSGKINDISAISQSDSDESNRRMRNMLFLDVRGNQLTDININGATKNLVYLDARDQSSLITGRFIPDSGATAPVEMIHAGFDLLEAAQTEATWHQARFGSYHIGRTIPGGSQSVYHLNASVVDVRGSHALIDLVESSVGGTEKFPIDRIYADSEFCVNQPPGMPAGHCTVGEEAMPLGGCDFYKLIKPYMGYVETSRPELVQSFKDSLAPYAFCEGHS